MTGLPAFVMMAATVVNGPDVSYTLTLSDGPTVTIAIDLPGDNDGSTELSVAKEWGGIEHDHLQDLLGVSALAGGREAAVDHPGENVWRVTHEPGAPITVTYTIARHDDRPKANFGNDYRPILRPDLFHLIANLGLLVPDRLRDGAPHDFGVRWNGFAGAGWSVVSSLGPGEAPITARMSTDEFVSTLWVAGRIRVHEQEIHGQRLGVSVLGDAWSFSDDAFVGLVARIVAAEREFFDDHSVPWYLVSLIPTNAGASRGTSLGGTGLTNSFALFMTTNVGLDARPNSGMSVQYLLAHEYFHNWNGHALTLRGEERLGYWFSEGFTDYFARRMLLRAGLIDARAYADDVNQKMGRYRSSPVKNAPNSRIAEEFWSNRDVSDLPYIRGDLAALAIDESVRARSGGARSLDDVMRGLVKRARSEGFRGDTESLLGVIRQETDADFAARLQEFLVDGSDFTMPATLRDPGMKLAVKRVRQSEPGFRVGDAQKSGIIAGVAEGGSAYAAGLRNGQKLREFEMVPGSEGKSPRARVVVEDQGERRTIEYNAVGEPREVEMYEIAHD